VSWRKWSDLFDFDRRCDDRPELPPISEEEARLYCEAITRAETTGSAEPRKGEWEKRYGEDWASWLKRSASQQPRRERDDG